jgi:hypothetical protein
MITSPSPAELKALHALGNQTGWPEVREFLEGELIAVHRLLSEAKDDVTLRQMQGRAQLIREFLKLVSGARQALEKARVNTL